MSFPETATLERRLSRVRETLDSLGLDALIVTDLINIRYLSNHVGSAGVLVLTRDAVHLLIDFRYDAAVHELQRSRAACPACGRGPYLGAMTKRWPAASSRLALRGPASKRRTCRLHATSG
jgi:Xaa-Pro aminopeptidase